MLDKLDRGQDVHAVDAALKRHEAISTEVNAGVSRGCVCMCVCCDSVCVHVCVVTVCVCMCVL